MTEPGQPQNPYDPNQPDDFVVYQSPILPTEDARKHLRLVVIFNYISVALDVCLCLVTVGFGIVFLVVPDLPQNPGDPPPLFMGIMYLAIGVFAVALAIVKAIATRKLQRRAPGAWGWGLALGIIGCVQFFCGSCCCLQVAPGIYTLVIILRQDVRALLRSDSSASVPSAS